MKKKKSETCSLEIGMHMALVRSSLYSASVVAGLVLSCVETLDLGWISGRPRGENECLEQDERCCPPDRRTSLGLVLAHPIIHL